ncbi:MAG TPA: gamma-butyrobetaine hydroxylase-like domain-containing protein, partial [Aestuariivirga sp.]
MHHVEILDDGRAISLTLESGARLRFHAIWLRDNGWDAGTRAPGNGQRLITIADIPSQIRISVARMEGNSLSLTFVPEGKTIAYDLTWLQAHSYDQDMARETGW